MWCRTVSLRPSPHPKPYADAPPLTLAWLCPQRNEAAAYSRPSRFRDGFHSVLLTFIALACVAGIAIAAAAAFCLRRHAKQREKERLAALGPEGAADTTFEYQVGPCGMRDPTGCGTATSASLGVHGAAPSSPAGKGQGFCWGPLGAVPPAHGCQVAFRPC